MLSAHGEKTRLFLKYVDGEVDVMIGFNELGLADDWKGRVKVSLLQLEVAPIKP